MQRPLQVKDALNLDNKKDYGFVNVYVNEDLELFIDYNLLKQNITINNFARKLAYEKVISFFQYNLKLIRTNPDKALLNMNIHEINDTHFGSTKRGNESRGKGPSSYALDSFFKKIVKHGLDNKVIKEPMDLLLFTEGLGPDFFSDLITKIISKELYEFSINVLSQNNKLDHVQQTESKNLEYWDNIKDEWTTIVVPKLKIADSNILLVPHAISTKQINYNTNNFLVSVINDVKRKNEIKKLGKKSARTKKEIYEDEKKEYGSQKEIIFSEVVKNKNFLDTYHDKFNNSKFLMNNVNPLLNDNDIY